MSISKIVPSHALTDAMQGADRWYYTAPEYAVNSKGYQTVDGQKGKLSLVDVMPRLVPSGYGIEHLVVKAARTSFDSVLKAPEKDRALLRYLMRNRHTTPFEFVKFVFHVQLPIFVARQWIRHRTGAFNEMSGRYVELDIGTYLPEWRKPPAVGQTKQGSSGSLEIDAHMVADGVATNSFSSSLASYKKLLHHEVSKEQARVVLSVSEYTQWYWVVDLHNLLHFLSLRADSHAQREVRMYAEGIKELITPLVPWTMEAFDDYRASALTFSKQEQKILKKLVSGKIALLEGSQHPDWEALGVTEKNDFIRKYEILLAQGD